jgi:streptogrisin D
LGEGFAGDGGGGGAGAAVSGTLLPLEDSGLEGGGEAVGFNSVVPVVSVGGAAGGGDGAATGAGAGDAGAGPAIAARFASYSSLVSTPD